MRCFVHHETEAVGTCRACGKGLCPACVTDLGQAICCKGNCEAKIRMLDSQVAQSGVVLAAQRRNIFIAPAFIVMMGIISLVFTRGGGEGSRFVTAAGLSFIAFGIIAGVLSYRHAKALGCNAVDPEHPERPQTPSIPE